MSSMQESAAESGRESGCLRAAPLCRPHRGRSAPARHLDLSPGWHAADPHQLASPTSVSCESTSGIANEGSLVLQAPSGSVQVSAFTERFKGEAPYRIGVVHDLSFVDRRQSTARDYRAGCLLAIAVLILASAAGAWRHGCCCDAGSKMLIGDIRGRRFLDNAAVRSAVAADPVAGAQGAARDRGEPAAGDRLPRELDAAGAAAGGARSAALPADDRGLEPRALHRTSSRRQRRDRSAGAGERHGHGARAGRCAPARASGSRTAAARRTARPSIDTITCAVPPDDPSYTLAPRVADAKPRSRGYYYGFSNEGLWPLCHLAYVRPAFRGEDWRGLQAVNAKFAEVVARRRRSSEDPVILIQDFHFALLPGLICAAATQGDHRAVLAHPLAQCRDLRRVPVEARDAAAHADGRHPRLSHAAITARISLDAWTASSNARSTTSA